MGVGGLSGVVQSEGFAFEKHTVVVDQHRAVNKFECALAVILEVTDCVEGVGIVAFGLYLEAQLDSLAFGDFIAVGHDFHGKGIGLLYVEVVGTGGQRDDDCKECNPEAEEAAGSKADFADFVDDCLGQRRSSVAGLTKIFD